MNNFSIRAHLEERYQVTVGGKGKITCPFCQHPTMAIKGDELAKCFHPACGRFINARSIQSKREHLQQFLWEFMGACHQALVGQSEEPEKLNHGAWRYLTQERKVHPQVITESPVLGAIPKDFDFDARCEQYRSRISREVDPKKKEQILETFDAQTQALKEQVRKYPGWLVFGYTDHTHRLLSLKFREPFTKRIYQFKSFSSGGVFNLHLFETDDSLPWPYLLLAEGEFNILSLQSLLVEYGLTYCRALALGGASSVDWKTLGRFREQWILFQDNDEAGHSLAMVMQSYRTFRLTSSPYPDEDLDGFIHRFNSPQKAFKMLQQLIGEAQPKYRFVKAIGASVNGIRCNHDSLKAFEVNQQVGQLIGRELLERGQFYRTTVAPFFLDHETRMLYLVNKTSKETQRYLHRFKLNPSEPLHQYVLHELERMAFEQGEETQIYQFTHYDRASNRLYLFNRDTEVYRLSTESIDVVDNGTDGILFEPLSGYQPFERQDVNEDKDLLSELFLESTNLDEGVLSAKEYRLLLEGWVYHLFFDGLHATHPIAAFVGPKGSSKTSSLKRLGLLLFGDRFQVSPIPDKPDDFDAAVTNDFLVGFDNVDAQTPWLNNKLAVVATGGCIKRRELYSTNNLIEYPIRARVAITSRTPKFRRDDVAERLLIFPLKTLNKKVSEKHLMDTALAERDRFMSWLLLRLQEILLTLEETEDKTVIETDFRMADFATFLLRLAMADGLEDKVQGILERLITAQSQFTLEQDPLFELLDILAHEHPAKPFTTAELFQELTQISARTGIRFGYKSANSLGQKLAHLKANIEQMLNMQVGIGSGNTKIYTFRPHAQSALNTPPTVVKQLPVANVSSVG